MGRKLLFDEISASIDPQIDDYLDENPKLHDNHYGFVSLQDPQNITDGFNRDRRKRLSTYSMSPCSKAM
jgi:hypothetical protein